MYYFLTKKYIIFYTIILLSLFSSAYFFSTENNYYSINRIISFFKLDVEYNQDIGSLLIKKNKKSVLILLDSPYILIGEKKYFINEYIKSEQGQFFIPKISFNRIINYFSKNKINLFFKQDTSLDKVKDINDFFLNINRDVDNLDSSNSLEIKNNIIEKDDLDTDFNIKNKYIYEEKPKYIKINAIIIDPGHGGTDPGAIGYSGIKEKNIVLRSSLILVDKLKSMYPDKKIILTRNKDIFVPLEKRAKIANYVFNKYGTSLFISIHVNASRSKKSYGFETWYLVEEYRRNIIKKGEISEDSDVEKVLNSMLNNEIYKESRELAKKIQENLVKQIGYVSKDRGIKEQTYFVIKKSIMPAVLVEIGFNTNKYEEIRLTKYSYLNKISIGICQGIINFIDEYEKTYGFTK